MSMGSVVTLLETPCWYECGQIMRKDNQIVKLY